MTRGCKTSWATKIIRSRSNVNFRRCMTTLSARRKRMAPTLMSRDSWAISAPTPSLRASPGRPCWLIRRPRLASHKTRSNNSCCCSRVSSGTKKWWRLPRNRNLIIWYSSELWSPEDSKSKNLRVQCSTLERPCTIISWTLLKRSRLIRYPLSYKSHCRTIRKWMRLFSPTR